MRNFQLPGRSPLRVTEAAVATSHPLASASALNTLKAGGNAIDAAVSAAAVLAVVEPQSTGIGGDGFMLYAPKGADKIIGFNGSGRAPQAAHLEWFEQNRITEIEQHSPHAVTIPGVVDMWSQVIADHGTMELGRVLEDAIRYAAEGYAVADRVAFDWQREAATLAHDKTAAARFLPVPQPGDIHTQPELAETLRLIAKFGRDGFYRGPVAEDMVQHLQTLGGLHSIDDFAVAKGQYVKPVTTSYRGRHIHQIPPNNQGLTALLMLNILEGFDLGKIQAFSAERLHLEIEAARLAYKVRDEQLGDPNHAPVPISTLLAKEFAAHLRKRIKRDRAMTDLKPIKLEMSDTVYLCVVDRDRNAVSFINSIFHSFGSGIMGPKSGVLLQNRGMSFRIDRTHHNGIAPGKQPLHTIMPGMVTNDGRAEMPYGVMGGDFQPFGHAHLIQNIFDFDMDPQAALDAPRVFASEGAVMAEDSIDSATRKALRELGHEVVDAPEPLGGGQAIRIDWDKGTLTAGSDPRKDGCAIGY